MANQLESRLIIAGFDRTKAAFLSATKNARAFGTAVRTASVGMTGRLKGIHTQVSALDKSFIGLGATIGTLGTLTVLGGITGISRALMESSDRLDEMSKKSRLVGISFQNMRRFVGTASLAGVDQEKAISALTNAARAYDSIKTGAKGAGKELMRIDSILAGQIKGAKSTKDAYNMMLGALHGAKGARRITLSQLFFKEDDMGQLADLTEKQWNQLFDEFDKRGGVLTDKMGQDVEDFNDSLTRMTQAWQGVADTTLPAVATQLTPIVNSMGDWVVQNREWMKSNIVKGLLDFAGAVKDIKAGFDALVNSPAYKEITEFLTNHGFGKPFGLPHGPLARALGVAGPDTTRSRSPGPAAPVTPSTPSNVVGAYLRGPAAFNEYMAPKSGGTIMAPNSTIVIPNARKLGVGDQPGLGAPYYRYFRPEGRAAGGPVSRGAAAWVGENGPELVHFGKDATVIPADKSQRLAMYSFARAVTAPFQGLTGAISDLGAKIARLTELLAGGRAALPGGGVGAGLSAGGGGGFSPRVHHPFGGGGFPGGFKSSPIGNITGTTGGQKLGWWTPERAAYGIEYLKKNAGLSDVAARGLVARWAGVESTGGGPGAFNRGSGATGIAQWLGPRLRAGVPKGYEAQLGKVAQELKGPEGRAYQMMLAAKTPAEAAIAAAEFERAEGFQSGMGDAWVGKTLRAMKQLPTGYSSEPAMRPAPAASVVRHELGEGKLAIQIKAENARVTGIKSSRLENVATTIGVDNSGNARWKPGMQP